MRRPDAKSRIIKAFLSLYSSTSINKIKVSELISKANCSRRSFYNNYSDVFDLERTLKEEFFKEMEETVLSSEKEANGCFLTIFDKYTDLLLAYTSNENGQEFIKETADRYIAALEKTSGNNYNPFYYKGRYYFTIFCLAGFVSCLRCAGGKISDTDINQIKSYLNEVNKKFNKKYSISDNT
jgi:AcrR family transcriptional regulator